METRALAGDAGAARDGDTANGAIAAGPDASMVDGVTRTKTFVPVERLGMRNERGTPPSSKRETLTEGDEPVKVPPAAVILALAVGSIASDVETRSRGIAPSAELNVMVNVTDDRLGDVDVD